MNKTIQYLLLSIIVFVGGTIVLGLQIINNNIEKHIEQDLTGLTSGQYFQHYYNNDGKLIYSCISNDVLSSDECLEQYKMRMLDE